MKNGMKHGVAVMLKKIGMKAAEVNANSTCNTYFHQEKMPAKAKSLRKF